MGGTIQLGAEVRMALVFGAATFMIAMIAAVKYLGPPCGTFFAAASRRRWRSF